MRATRVALIGGVVVLGLLCWLAALGFTAVTEVLVTLFALVVLVGGGNWLSGRGGTRSRPTYAASSRGDRSPPAEPTGGDDRAGGDRAGGETPER